MSRTIKDMPIGIRFCDWKGEKFKDSGEQYNRHFLSSFWEGEDYHRFVHGNLLNFSDPVVGRTAREQNRLYRTRCKQLMREGRYDDILPPKRNARWLA